jgi:hypothetical protein
MRDGFDARVDTPRGDWLDPGISREHAISLLEPYPAELMRATESGPVCHLRHPSPRGRARIGKPVEQERRHPARRGEAGGHMRDGLPRRARSGRSG